jgi:hypothetical protein
MVVMKGVDDMSMRVNDISGSVTLSLADFRDLEDLAKSAEGLEYNKKRFNDLVVLFAHSIDATVNNARATTFIDPSENISEPLRAYLNDYIRKCFIERLDNLLVGLKPLMDDEVKKRDCKDN